MIRKLCSADKQLPLQPPCCLKTYVYHAFCCAAPVLWNNIPHSVKTAKTFDSFKIKLDLFYSVAQWYVTAFQSWYMLTGPLPWAALGWISLHILNPHYYHYHHHHHHHHHGSKSGIIIIIIIIIMEANPGINKQRTGARPYKAGIVVRLPILQCSLCSHRERPWDTTGYFGGSEGFCSEPQSLRPRKHQLHWIGLWQCWR